MAGFDPADPTFQNDPGRFRLVFQTRWLLTEIRDTQATPNVVTIAYEVSQSGMGYSTAPRHIAYGGYNIWLNYDWKPTHARTKYATGRSSWASSGGGCVRSRCAMATRRSAPMGWSTAKARRPARCC
ncbi:MAG: hypothetical protein JKP98_03765 [Rhodobacteraceae bacterium]|nr:hypothetical protein [Paracoccaceae bacterium]